MERSNCIVAGLLAMALCRPAAHAEQITVKHVQLPMHRFMVARSEAGQIIANVEFSQAVQSNQVTMQRDLSVC